VEDQLAATGGGVDLLGQTLEADPSLVELGHRLDEILERTPQSVEPPDDEDVALPDIVERLLQAEPLGAGAAGGVGEDLLATRRREGVLLQVEDLFEGGDTGITNNHGIIVS